MSFDADDQHAYPSEEVLIFFRSQWAYRSLESTAEIIPCLFFLGAGYALLRWSQLEFPPRIIGAILGIACSALGIYCTAWLAAAIIRNKQGILELRSDGIFSDGRLTSWSEIRRFAAYGSPAAAVRLFYEDRLGIPHRLSSRCTIAAAFYQRLIAELQRDLARRFPHVQWGGYFSDD